MNTFQENDLASATLNPQVSCSLTVQRLTFVATPDEIKLKISCILIHAKENL